MKRINVLTLIPLPNSIMAKIKAVSPRLNVIDASPLMPHFPPLNEPPDPQKEAQLDTLLAEAEILFGFSFPRGVVARAPELKWVQTVSAGVDRTLTPDIAASRVTLTNVSGMHAVPISELVFALILNHAKQMGMAGRQQSARKWERYATSILEGKTLGILGLGNIGRRIAHLGKAFGMKVVATRRHARGVGKARDVDSVYPPEQMNSLLAESDYIVNCLPFTRETAKIIGQAELRQMKPTAFLVNIGRGGTMDEEALVQALKEKRLAGAGLDTLQKEPLPAESPLWEMPGVIITPHISGATDDYMEKAAAIFCENLVRYLGGKRLHNIVNKKLGY
ncbi:MAG TPA: D-2-hydroxyacid dehydrogenase [Dehalococcoidales bacterium]|nr:D-2-hydroxyacid dehydrogenase [Dehalococcoidales bacterium]